VVFLTGPRQSGKTTLLQQMLGQEYAYVSLEAPDVRQAATVDPRGFLAMYPAPVIFMRYSMLQICSPISRSGWMPTDARSDDMY